MWAVFISFLVALFFSGCGSWLIVPFFSLQPSYWEFKKLCKLNELPNNEEKYNKMLAYYDMSLDDIDDIDWKKINEDKYFLCKDEHKECLPNVREYMAKVMGKQVNHRLETTLWVYSNKYNLNSDNITDMKITASWQTRFFVLDGNEGSGFYWDELEAECIDVLNKEK
ncbi:hypothetical protein [Helicobacter sp. T3_23-1056]